MSEKGSVSTYRRIVKSTGLFGGVQVIGIICSFVKVKFIAIWLGGGRSRYHKFIQCGA